MQGRIEGRANAAAFMRQTLRSFPVSCFLFLSPAFVPPVSCFLSPVSCLLSPVVTFSLQHQHIMTDLRAQTFRLTQFARCAG